MPTSPDDELLGRGDEAIAWTDDGMSQGAAPAPIAIGERGDRLRTADRQQAIGPGDRGGRQRDRRGPRARPPTIVVDAGDARGDRPSSAPTRAAESRPPGA
jgi:hypothetical protein